MRNDIIIHPHERVDDLHRDGHLIIQDPKRFCFGVDAVILSGFAKVKKGENVLDLGTGTGIIPILLAAKTEGKHFTGLEIQTESAEMANRSVLLNELEERVSIKEGDIKEAMQLFGASSFDVVTSNPPYMNEGGGLVNPFAAKAIARHEILCSLEDVVAAAAKLLPPVMAASISSSVMKCWTVGTWERSEEKVLRGRSRSFRFSQIFLGL